MEKTIIKKIDLKIGQNNESCYGIFEEEGRERLLFVFNKIYKKSIHETVSDAEETVLYYVSSTGKTELIANMINHHLCFEDIYTRTSEDNWLCSPSYNQMFLNIFKKIEDFFENIEREEQARLKGFLEKFY